MVAIELETADDNENNPQACNLVRDMVAGVICNARKRLLVIMRSGILKHLI